MIDGRPEPFASLPLRLLAALHALLFAGFLASLLLAAGRVEAAETACTGSDMVAELERKDPALLAKVRTEAAAVPNGDALLWRLEKPGRPASWLFGTMHVTDPRVTALTPAAQRAFDSASTVVIETTDVLDQSKVMAALLGEPELMMFTDGTTLLSLLPQEDAELVASELEERGIPPASVAKMKPWMLTAMLALPACELSRKSSGEEVLDVRLANEAKGLGKELAGLESAADQLRAMASLPIEFHMQGLVETLRLGDRMDDAIETMILLYLRGDTGMVVPLFRAMMPGATTGGDGYADFEQAMILARNRTMAERAEPLLAAGSVFVAVGALHLPGEQGLVELLRKAGYTVTPVR